MIKKNAGGYTVLAMERLDKIIASTGLYSRKDVKKLVKEGRVEVSGVRALSPDMKLDPETAAVTVDGTAITYQKYIYLMMNKPSGVLSATKDGREQTVLDLLPEEYRKRDIFPVGRLDKDTEGLLLITDDGSLAHDLLSPRKHINKTYYVIVEGSLSPEDRQRFRDGITLADGYQCMSADLQILGHSVEAGLRKSEALITIQEGKYHQIKRMLGVLDKPVLYLKRLSMGPLTLDESLKPGTFRPLTKEELNGLQHEKK